MEPMTSQGKDRLDSSNEPGWYECRWTGGAKELHAMWWTGEILKDFPADEDEWPVSDFTDYRGPLKAQPSEEREELVTDQQAATTGEG